MLYPSCRCADASPANKNICYFGSLYKIDGIKLAWLEQWRHLTARGWRVRYVTCESTTSHHPQLVAELEALRMELRHAELPVSPDFLSPEVASNFAELMYQLLLGYRFDIDAMFRDIAMTEHLEERELLNWLATCWRVLVDGVTGCDLIVHAMGDDTDR